MVVDPFDGPEIAALGVALLTLVGSIVTVVVANKGRQHAQVVRTQVENEHAHTKNPNLRDDLDDKHVEIMDMVDHVLKSQDRIESKVGVLDRKVGFLEDGWHTNRSRIEELENTDPAVRRQDGASAWGPPRTRKEWRSRHAR